MFHTIHRTSAAEYDFKLYQPNDRGRGTPGGHCAREGIEHTTALPLTPSTARCPTAADRAILHQTVVQDFVQTNPNVIVTRSEILEGKAVVGTVWVWYGRYEGIPYE